MAFRFSRKNGPKKVEKIRLRKGDLVEVLTGKDRKKRGKKYKGCEPLPRS